MTNPDPEATVVDLPTPVLTYKLRPTPAALFDVCEAAGSIREAYRRASEGDVRILFAIAVAGTQVRGKGADDLKAALFQAGLAQITPPIVDFLGVLMNGGRRETGTQDGGDEGNA